MLLLMPIAVLTLVLSAGARIYGASFRVAFFVPTLPALIVFVYFAIRFDIEIGPHGGIVPAWIVAGIFLAIVAIISFVAAKLFGRPHSGSSS